MATDGAHQDEQIRAITESQTAGKHASTTIHKGQSTGKARNHPQEGETMDSWMKE